VSRRTSASPFDRLMSQLESSYTANPTLTRKVLPCHMDIGNLLHVTQIPLRLKRWNEDTKSGVEVQPISAFLRSLFTATLNPRWEARRQVQNLYVILFLSPKCVTVLITYRRSADQSASGTTTVSLSTGMFFAKALPFICIVDALGLQRFRALLEVETRHRPVSYKIPKFVG